MPQSRLADILRQGLGCVVGREDILGHFVHDADRGEVTKNSTLATRESEPRQKTPGAAASRQEAGIML